MSADTRTNSGKQPAEVTTHVAEHDRGPGVTEEERHKLAECCAFFKAAHYRDAAPGEIRGADIEAAEAEIEAVIKSGEKKRTGE